MAITELFSLLSTLEAGTEASGVGTRFRVNLNRNRIRSISAYSSNSIFYFPTIVSDRLHRKRWEWSAGCLKNRMRLSWQHALD